MVEEWIEQCVGNLIQMRMFLKRIFSIIQV